jgi:PAS domain S-box-containing protein
MVHDEHHEQLVRELAEQLKPIFSNSPQAIYLYLDDTHKICNQKFADLLGYNSISDWVENETPVSDVTESDQEKVIRAYGQASENFKASQLSVRINTKNGETINTQVIMVPITYKEEVFVIHFISKE